MDKTDSLRSIILDEWHKLTITKHSVSAWDAFISLAKDKFPVYLLTLKADMLLLEYIASGLSVNSIFQTTGIPSKTVRNVAFTWGLVPLEQTLDFNPLLVYNDSMTPDALRVRMDDILPEPLSFDMCEIVIHNIERYFELEEILRKEDL